MKIRTKIILSILIPIILNIVILIIILLSSSTFDSKVHHQKILLKETYLYFAWAVLQIIIIIVIFKKSNNKRQLIAIPIITFLFILLFASFSSNLINYKPEEFDKGMWDDGNHYYRINYIEDLIMNKKLENKCYDEIIQMLGNPEINDQQSLKYDLGFGFLIIHLNDKCAKSIEAIKR